MLRFFYFLIFPLLLAYPNGLLVGTYLNYVYIVLVFISFLLFDKRNRISFSMTNKFFLALFFLILFANLNSSLIRFDIELFDYLSSTLRYLSYFLISTIMVSTVSNSSDFEFWIKSYLFGFLLSLVVLYLDSYRIFWIDPVFKIVSFEELNTLDIYFRAYGAYLTPISAGMFILNTFFLTLSLFVTNIIVNKKEKLILWLLTVLSVIGIVMTASRTSLIALGVSICLLILINKKRIQFILTAFFAVIIIYQTGILNNYLENISMRNETQISGGLSLLEGSGRVDTVMNSIRLFFNERTFFFGVGPSEYAVGDGTYSLAHNGFLSLVFCYGFVGFILFLFISVRLYKMVFSKDSYFNINIHKFLKLYLGLFFVGNFTSFISSDGPVTHFWIISFLFFLFFIQKYIEIKKMNL